MRSRRAAAMAWLAPLPPSAVAALAPVATMFSPFSGKRPTSRVVSRLTEPTTSRHVPCPSLPATSVREDVFAPMLTHDVKGSPLSRRRATPIGAARHAVARLVAIISRLFHFSRAGLDTWPIASSVTRASDFSHRQAVRRATPATATVIRRTRRSRHAPSTVAHTPAHTSCAHTLTQLATHPNRHSANWASKGSIRYAARQLRCLSTSLTSHACIVVPEIVHRSATHARCPTRLPRTRPSLSRGAPQLHKRAPSDIAILRKL